MCLRNFTFFCPSFHDQAILRNHYVAIASPSALGCSQQLKEIDEANGTRLPISSFDPVPPSNMDITAFIIQGRDKALLYGDYSIYHDQLSKKLLNARRKLGISTRNRGKFHKRDAVTAEEIGENRE